MNVIERLPLLWRNIGGPNLSSNINFGKKFCRSITMLLEGFAAPKKVCKLMQTPDVKVQ